MFADWSAFDRRHIWHPYAPATGTDPLYKVVDAAGVELQLDDGRRLIDGMSSWWAAIHGYRHPALDAALHGQIDRFAHVMFGGLTHEPALALAERLIAITPRSLDHVFFADSGSVAVEVALKMAIQCWAGRGRPDKQRFLTVRNGYHGDTFGAMSVCDPLNGMHRLFAGALPRQLFAPPPAPASEAADGRDLEAMHQLLATHHNEIAAVIIEPLVQGAGGMRFYRPEYLSTLARLCREYEVLLILDEIATGFGRTGSLFAAEQADVEADILCLGKALTGGYMTLAATLVSDQVATDICRGEPGALMHGPTFMANPLACTVAAASIDLLLQQDWQACVRRIEHELQALEACRDLPGVRDVRIKGAIGVVELAAERLPPGLQRTLVDAGVWLRPFRNLVYTMPPFIIEPSQVAHICVAVHDALHAAGDPARW